MNSELALCFYPTTVALVDDNTGFLEALSTHIGKHFNLCTFTDPREGLAYANGTEDQLEKFQCAGPPPEDYENMVEYALNRPGIMRNESQRYDELSVVVVDYHMPHLNGLEFCNQMQNTNVKKILLTSRISDTDVIRAFNEGLINHYVFKNRSNMVGELNSAITRLQNDYFRDMSRIVKSRALEGSHTIFTEPALSNYFFDVCKHLDVSEYYFVTQPSRYILRTRSGNEIAMLIFSEAELERHALILREEAAPKKLIDHVESRKYVPFFDSDDGYYEPDKHSENAFLLKAHEVAGKHKYYCSIYSPRNCSRDDIPLTSLVATFH